MKKADLREEAKQMAFEPKQENFPKEFINLGIFYVGGPKFEPLLQDLKKNLENLNSKKQKSSNFEDYETRFLNNLKIRIKFAEKLTNEAEISEFFINQPAQDENAAKSSQIDAFLVVGMRHQEFFPSLKILGDFLHKKLIFEGKGVIISSFSGPEFEEASGIGGKLENEIPFLKNAYLGHDGPLDLKKSDCTSQNFENFENFLQNQQTILRNVENFASGDFCWRNSMKILKKFPEDDVNLIAEWNDPNGTPLVITKTLNSKGNLFVLNAWPFSQNAGIQNYMKGLLQ